MILAIYGSGGAGCELMEMIEAHQALNSRWDEIVFIDDVREEGHYRGHRTLTFDSFSKTIAPNAAEVIISVGEPKYRKILSDKVCGVGHPLSSVVHPFSQVGASAKIGCGVVVHAFVAITADVVIEDDVCVDPNSVIHHGSRVGRHSFVASGAIIAGNVDIGERVFVGAGAVIREKVKIGDGAVIGAGAVVVSDVEPATLVLGCPARASDHYRETVFG